MTKDTDSDPAASLGYAERWMFPELPPEALARDRSIAKKFTRVTKAIDEDWPDAHAAWLTVGPQHFEVTVCETREEAGWHCWMLAKAMMAVIDSAVSGVFIEGPKVA
jgi:hypothetical protein